MFPKVPQSSLGILRVPQLPPSLGHPPLNLSLVKITENLSSKETNVSGLPLLQLGVWDTPGRDPRGFCWQVVVFWLQ